MMVSKGENFMLNQVVLVGRLVREVALKTTEQGKKMSYITLAVPRSFKNMNGEYDTDFIECILWDKTAESTATYCHKGDILGIKGRIQSRDTTIGDKKITILEVVGEKVTFLTSKGKDSPIQEEEEES